MLQDTTLEDLLSTCQLTLQDILSLQEAMEQAGVSFHPGVIHYPFINPLLLREVEEEGIDVSHTSITSLGLPRWAETPLLAGGIEMIGQLAGSSTFYVRAVLGLGGRPHNILRHHLEDHLTNLLYTAPQDGAAGQQGALVQTLPLNARTLGALRRAGVFTVDQLRRMTDEELSRLRGLGPGRIAEIKALLPVHLPAVPSSPDAALQAEAVSLRPDVASSSVRVLELSANLTRRLESAGITTLGQLVEGGEALLAEVPRVGAGSIRRIQAQMEAYLLRALETVGEDVPGIVAETQAASAQGTLDERLTVLVSRLSSQRLVRLMTWRYGLDGRVRTLEEVGRQLGVSRERVRQLERLAIRALRQEHPTEVENLSRAPHEALAAVGGVAPMAYMLKQLPTLFRIERLDLSGAARLLLELSDDCQQLSGRRCALKGALVEEIELVDDSMVAHLRKRMEPISVAEMTAEVARTRSYPLIIEKYPSFSLSARARANPLTDVLPCGAIVLKEWTRTRLDNTIRALRELGKPSHYRKIAALVQSRYLPDGTTVSEEAIHNLLLSEAAFVRKQRGIYGLAEWEDSDPDTARAIESVLREVDGPLHRDELARRLSMDERVVERCLIIRPEFAPAGGGYYRLAGREYGRAATSHRRRTTVLVPTERSTGKGLSVRVLITPATRESGTLALNTILRPMLPIEGEVQVGWRGTSTSRRVDRLHRGRAHLSGLQRFLRSEDVSPGEYIYLEHRPDQHPPYLLYTEAQWHSTITTPSGQ